MTDRENGALRRVAKGAFVTLAVGASLLVLLPLVLLVKVEEWITGGRSERLFSAGKELLAPVPTIVGSYLRSTYYWACCWDVHPDTRMLIGSMIAHRQTRIGPGCLVGAWTIVGAVDIEPRVLIGARCSLLSGKRTHRRKDGRLSPFRVQELPKEGRFRIGADCWIGDQAVVMASLPEGCTIGAGSVVYTTPPPEALSWGTPPARSGSKARTAGERTLPSGDRWWCGPGTRRFPAGAT